MRFIKNRSETRHGAIAPMTVLLLIPLVGMLAFSVDVGYMTLVQSELQNAADAAALAGAEKLQGLYVQFYMPGQTQQAAIYNKATNNTGTWDCPKYTAKKFGSYNKAGNVSITVPDGDITFSYRDGSSTIQSAAYPDRFPNTITVTSRRDGTANTPLNLFFGPIFNKNSVNMTATASATIYAGEATSATPIPGVNAHILPVALDINIWKEFLNNGKSGDGTIHLDDNGLPQLLVYPNSGTVITRSTAAHPLHSSPRCFASASKAKRCGLPVLTRFPRTDMPTPLPRQDRWVHLSLLPQSTAAFPDLVPGRLLRFGLLGLLDVHSRFGLPAR